MEQTDPACPCPELQPMGDQWRMHASCVAVGNRALLIAGASNAGKSSLALALIDRGAALVADDQTLMARKDDRLLASAPHPLVGQIEIRNLGIVSMPHIEAVPVALGLLLTPHAPRFIDTPSRWIIDNVAVPAIALWPDGPNLAIKAELALRHYGLPVA